MFESKSRVELERELTEVEEALAAHPWNEPHWVEYREVTEHLKPQGKDAVEDELARRGLPPLVEGGMMTVKYLASYGKLMRRKHKLERKLGQHGGSDELGTPV